MRGHGVAAGPLAQHGGRAEGHFSQAAPSGRPPPGSFICPCPHAPRAPRPPASVLSRRPRCRRGAGVPGPDDARLGRFRPDRPGPADDRAERRLGLDTVRAGRAARIGTGRPGTMRREARPRRGGRRRCGRATCSSGGDGAPARTGRVPGGLGPAYPPIKTVDRRRADVPPSGTGPARRPRRPASPPPARPPGPPNGRERP